MGKNGQVPTVVIETESEDVLTNKAKSLRKKDSQHLAAS
jgi:hypothetical protein